MKSKSHGKEQFLHLSFPENLSGNITNIKKNPNQPNPFQVLRLASHLPLHF